MLSVNNHNRDSVGLCYVYPVVSRRAGGVSVGINLNPNNACNWACIYCQVPDLKRGGPPPINLLLLEKELRSFLHEITQGDYLKKNVPAKSRRLKDIAFSGNGEPTSASKFGAAVAVVERVMKEFSLPKDVKIRLITNGSLMHRASVRQGISRIGALDGEVWFKVDSATEAGSERINGIRLSSNKVKQALLDCAALSPTWVQTCYFAIDGEEASLEEQAAYLDFIKSVRGRIKGVHLYGLARPSLQPAAGKISKVSAESFQRFAQQVSLLGVEVVCNP